MLFLKIFLSGLLVLVIGTMAYFAFVDVPVPQTDKIETLSASDFQ